MKTLTELDNLSASLLTKLPELMNTGTVYANDLFIRFIKYIVIVNSVYAVGNFILTTIVSVIIYRTIKSAMKKVIEDRHSDAGILAGIITIFGLMIIAFSVATFFEALTRIITALTVPELSVINYFK